MKSNPTLRQWQKLLLQKISPSAIDNDRTWFHYDKLITLQLIRRTGARSPTKAWTQQLMSHCLPMLRLIWKECGAFTNPYWSPKTAIGDYLWSYQVCTVQELLWLKPEFTAGFEYAREMCRGPRRKDEPGRDAFPFNDYPRRLSWDTGYIFGCALHHHPDNFRAWRQWLQSTNR